MFLSLPWSSKNILGFKSIMYRETKRSVPYTSNLLWHLSPSENAWPSYNYMRERRRVEDFMKILSREGVSIFLEEWQELRIINCHCWRVANTRLKGALFRQLFWFKTVRVNDVHWVSHQWPSSPSSLMHSVRIFLFAVWSGYLIIPLPHSLFFINYGESIGALE